MTMIIHIKNYGGAYMERQNKMGMLLGFLATLVAIVAIATTFLVVREKQKKDDEELERYLDCSIQ